MHFGLAIFPTDETLSPAELGRLTEQRGFESLWFPEHTHIPASRESPYPAGGELPREYTRTYDPFVALTAAAAATQHIRVATGIALVIERDPIVTAKEAASVDRLSGGRLLFGVGAGWNREEMANHGTDPRTRMRLLVERVAAIKAIWTQEEATYQGEFVAFERIWCAPKPLQRPHPPVFVGGNGPTVLDRVLAVGDAWYPNHEPSVAPRIAQLQQRAADGGRAPVPVTVSAMPSDPATIETYAQAGVERLVFYIPTADQAAIERRLAAIEGAIAQFSGSA